jgi:hypothetical protein
MSATSWKNRKNAATIQSDLQGLANNDPRKEPIDENSRGYLMKLSISLKDIMLAPGKRFDPSSFSEKDVIERVKKIYGVITKVMDIAIKDGMVEIEFRDTTPEKFKSAMKSFFTRTANIKGLKGSPVHQEAKNLYRELSTALGVQKQSH